MQKRTRAASSGLTRGEATPSICTGFCSSEKQVWTTDIPFKGSAEMLTSLLGGHTDASFMVYGAVADHVKSGQVRYLVTVGARRFSNLPNVPCVVELGFPEVAKLPTYVGLYIHKDTPEPIKKTLVDAMKKIYDDPEFKKASKPSAKSPSMETLSS